MAYDFQWMDNFSVFANIADMLNGTPWGSLTGASVDADPDPSADAGAKVLTPSSDGNGGARLSLPAPGTKIRVGFRLWMTQLPSGGANGAFNVRFMTAGLGLVYKATVQPNGSILIFNNANAQIADSIVPLVTGNAATHFEMVVDSVTGEIGFWREGIHIAALSIVDGAPTGSTIAVVGFYATGPGGNGQFARLKDVFFADGADQIGPVTIYRRNIVGTTASGWGKTGGADETAILGGYSNTLTATANVANNDTVQVDGVNYKFTTGGVDAGAPAGTAANPWLIKVGASEAASLTNLYNAFNASGVAGTDYSTALTAHATVTATGYSATQLGIKGKAGTALSASCTEGSGSLSWKTTTLNQGPEDFSYISAGTPPPAEATMTFEDLPASVVGVRSLMMLSRTRKSDGGDATVQMALDSAGSHDLGADRPVSVAFSYYGDVSEFDPSTAALWTPLGVNNATISINRTT